MEDRIFIPIAQVRPTSLLIYSVPEPPFNRSQNKFSATATYSGTVTSGAAKRIRKTINIFLLKSPPQCIVNPISLKTISFRLTFATLTISKRGLVDHREAYKKGLEPMLLRLRRSVGGLYLWKAELQERGQIHWHLTLNRFVNHTWLRDEWNNIQSKAGWLEGFRERQGHGSPNSTDIHAVWKVDRIDLYLAKYMAKGDPTKSIKGKVWGCSRELQAARYYSFVMEGEAEDWTLGKIETHEAQRINLPHCTVIDGGGRLFVPDCKMEGFKEWQRS